MWAGRGGGGLFFAGSSTPFLLKDDQDTLSNTIPSKTTGLVSEKEPEAEGATQIRDDRGRGDYRHAFGGGDCTMSHFKVLNTQ